MGREVSSLPIFFLGYPINMFKKDNLKFTGQALVEYILIFAFFTTMSLGIIRSMSNVIDESMGGLAWILTQELKSGVCSKGCYIYEGFVNR